MKKRILCILLILTMVASMLPLTAAAAYSHEYKAVESNYFYNQLNDRQKAIYKKLYDEFTGTNKEAHYKGKEFIDLSDLDEITDGDIDAYLKGNKDIFNDFAAAKDALDLDHSELWYIDSGYLTFRVTKENKEGNASDQYHVLVGPGRGETYLLGGQSIDNVEDKIKAVDNAITTIVNKAVADLNAANADGSYSDSDKTAYLVRNVHDQITKGIHYRYEIECSNKDNARYIRTLYGIVTHEGVCEAYSRTLQVALTKLGIQCVLIHGVQSKGTPEDHMWNAVNIPDNGTDRWYVVDATWDDPLTANWDGTRDLTFHGGVDGKETNTYLLVGQNVVGEYWHPSGYVSTGSFEFKYPTVETASFSGETVYGGNDGLKVEYSAGGTTEDSVPAGVFTVTYQGMNAAQAREKGLYFMVKMYDYHPDGTADVMDEWYYADATFVASQGNPYFGDHGGALRIYTSTCEYVEIAVTTLEPENRKTWDLPPASGQNALSNNPLLGYFQGDESDIIAQSGMLYNVNAGYEAPPYVKTQTPAPNGNATAGYQYRFKVTYDDLLYHILPTDEDAKNGIASVDAFEDNYEQAKAQDVQVRYITEQEDLSNYHAVIQHTIAGELPFDTDRDGIVDMDGTYTNFKWIYASDPVENGGRGECPNKDYHADGTKPCDVNHGCPIVGVEFNFRASDQWIDDVTQYTFSIEGVVGSRSNKFPNNFSVIAVVPGLCPACYRSQGIDWNLWGQPTLLDAPENLDLAKMAEAGGTDEETLKKLDEDVTRDDLNGRLMLVVEDKSKGSGSREDYEKIQDALEDSSDAPEGEVIGSSVFEINFNRICPMVKLKPNKGESLRVQVGYPAGVTYEKLGAGEVELKAYHFTRCSNDPEYYCTHYNDEGHKWGDDIISVEEITIVPTPYGMVIMCDAFSPFEIVAVKTDPSKVATVAAAEKKSTVIVVSGQNGVVEVNGKDAVGVDGNIDVTNGDSITFTVKPDSGYVVDTVSYGGETKNITSGENGTYTLSNITKSDVLSVTFIPKDVKKTEEEQGLGSTVIATVCTHTTLKDDPNDNRAEKDPTCTTAGYSKAKVCTECGQTVIPAKEIPATGHTVLETVTEATAATCTTSGTTAQIKCTVCNAEVSKSTKVQALGHVFTNYKETGKKTCQGTEVIATCDREGCNATETKFEDWGNLDHNFKLKTTVEATCTTDSVDIYECEWCQKTNEHVNTGTATGHDWGEDGFCKVCHEERCKGNHKIEVIPEVPATCTETGLTEGQKCTECGAIIKAPSPTPAKGHQYDPTTHICSVCGLEQPNPEHTPVEVPEIPATCTTTGLTAGIKCSGCGEVLKAQEEIPMIPHEYDVDDIKWVWSETNGVSVAAEVHCSAGDHNDIFTAELSYVTSKEPTCTEPGEAVYTATITIGEETYTDSDSDKTLEIPATGHTWDTENPVASSPATCTQHASHTYVCTVCGAENVEVDTESELLPHSFVPDMAKSTAATCTEAGLAVEKCAVCNLENTETIAALGHEYSNGKCVRCGADDPNYNYYPPVPQEPSTPVEPSAPEEPEKPWVNPYSDVADTAWYLEDLEFVSKLGLIKGYDDGTFKAGNETSRGQIMTILARLSGVDTEGGATWYEKGVAWAMEKGISDGTNLSKSLTRQELATMLYRFVGEPEVTGDLEAFKDASSVSSWARNAMIWAVQEGIIKGTDPVTLNPKGTAARSHVVAMLARFCREYEL